ncbi:MAG: hypothetical protein ACJATA_001555 [Sphingobacteriales bacterium]|jgi:hypothetical protein
MIMEYIKDIFFILIPSAAIFAAGFLTLRTFLDSQNKLKHLEMKANRQKNVLPLRLQAFERLTLLLERISPENLIVRVQKGSMSAKTLQQAMIAEIRSEFDHNLAQQLYISHKNWSLIKSVKEEVINMINTSGKELPQEATSIDFSRKFFSLILTKNETPTTKALLSLKKEAKELF